MREVTVPEDDSSKLQVPLSRLQDMTQPCPLDRFFVHDEFPWLTRIKVQGDVESSKVFQSGCDGLKSRAPILWVVVSTKGDYSLARFLRIVMSIKGEYKVHVKTADLVPVLLWYLVTETPQYTG